MLGAAPVAAWLGRRWVLPPPAPATSITAFLGEDGDTARYPRVTAPRAFVFPADHASHPDYRHEWWYFTGNLVTPSGRPFGFQLTFFRFAFAAAEPDSASAWATRQALLGHFALTDIAGRRFHAFQKLERPVLDISGTLTEPPSVWVRSWRASLTSAAPAAWSLRADDADIALRLNVVATKPHVAQGSHGYSAKGSAPGNASLYYSLTRLRAAGDLTLHGERFPVAGDAWLDREWGTSALADGIVGWDWFGLQLSDHSELTLYLLRDRDGTRATFSAGSWCAPDGGVVSLSNDDFTVRTVDHWRSPTTRARYPAGWEIRVPALTLALRVSPRVPAQEWQQRFRYWEGCVQIAGTGDGRAVAGFGYTELTGY